MFYVYVLQSERTGRRYTECVESDDSTFLRMPDQGLRFAAPGEYIPHCAGGCEHRCGGVDGIAALLEHHRAGGGAQWLAGDRNPVAAVQDGSLSPLCLGQGQWLQSGYKQQ